MTRGRSCTVRSPWPRSTCERRDGTPVTDGTGPDSPESRRCGLPGQRRLPPVRCWGHWPGSRSTAGPGRRPRTGLARPPCCQPRRLPMGEVLDRAFTEQRLLDAWAEVRDAALADGDAGPEVEQFEKHAARHISELAAALADGKFVPHPVVRVEISKPGGGVRKLAVPGLIDRIAERALLVELDALVDPLLLPWSFAYRHGLGVRDALASLAEARDAGAAWVARCDIDDCFEYIPRWEVLRRLRDVVPDEAAVDLVRRFMDRPVVGEHVAHAERGLGLHQGSPLSPLLCNLYLDRFDRAMLAQGYRAIRYSDDIAIPVPDRGTAEIALSEVARELGELRLAL